MEGRYDGVLVAGLILRDGEMSQIERIKIRFSVIIHHVCGRFAKVDDIHLTRWDLHPADSSPFSIG